MIERHDRKTVMVLAEPGQCIGEHRFERVAELRIRVELRVREEWDGGAEELDSRERIRLAGQQQHGAADGRPMRDTRLRVLGPARRVALKTARA